MLQRFFTACYDLIYHRSRDFWLFEGSIWLHTVAATMISVFMPIVLYEIGFSVWEIMVFYAVFHLINTPLNFIAQWMTYHYGAIKTVALGTVFNIAFFFALALLDSSDWLILLAIAGLTACYDALYYVGSVYLFVGSTKDPENTSTNTLVYEFVLGAAGKIGPIIGSAILLTTSSESMLLNAVAVGFIFSVLPLFWLRHIPTRPDHKPMGFKQFFSNIREQKNYITLSLYKIHEAADWFIWPLFIFLSTGNLALIAGLVIVIPIANGVFTILAGSIKREKRSLAIFCGAAGLLSVWLIRMVYGDATWVIYVTTALAALFAVFVRMPMDVNIFRRAGDIAPLAGSTYKNAVGMGTKFGLFALVVLLATTPEDIFKVTFVVGAGAMILLMIANRWFAHRITHR